MGEGGKNVFFNDDDIKFGVRLSSGETESKTSL